MQQQAMMAGVYFKAQESVEILDEFQGEKGKFLKTFAINDKRNKNGWRATWEGIKKNLPSFRGKPGIEFVKCDSDGCDLDHTEAQSKELSLSVQEPFRVTTIIETQLDENTHTAYFVHKIDDDDFWTKLENKEVKFVSPSIWPQTGGYEVLGQMENGQPMIDVWDWEGLHDAFVNRPAFGDDAKITAMCEGHKCPIKLLSAKEKNLQSASDAIQDCVSRKLENFYTKGERPTKEKLAIFFSECREQLSAIVDTGDVQHLQQVPLLTPHNKKKRFFTVSKKVYAKVASLHAAGKSVSESQLYDIIRKEEENNSFKSCTCSANQMPTPEEENEKLKASLKSMEEDKKELESKLAAQEKTDEEQHKAKVANFVAMLKATEEEDREKTASAIKAGCDEKDMKAMDEAEKEVKTARNAQEDPEKKELKASLLAVEQELAQPLVAKMAQARSLNGATEEQIADFKKSYETKSLKAIKEDYAKEQILIENTLSAAEENSTVEQKHFSFQGADGASPLNGKSLDEIFEEVN